MFVLEFIPEINAAVNPTSIPQLPVDAEIYS